MRLCAGGVSVCVGARGAETDSHVNMGIEFTPLLAIVCLPLFDIDATRHIGI